MADRTDWEDEVCSRNVFFFYAKGEFEKWKAERVELEILLKQASGYAHSLVGNLEILDNKFFYLRNEIRCGRGGEGLGQLCLRFAGVRVGLC